MARLGIPPHIADKILNHQAGTISGVAAVYQRHDFLAEREEALDRWGAHIEQIIANHKSYAVTSDATGNLRLPPLARARGHSP